MNRHEQRHKISKNHFDVTFVVRNFLFKKTIIECPSTHVIEGLLFLLFPLGRLELIIKFVYTLGKNFTPTVKETLRISYGNVSFLFNTNGTS